MSEQELPFIQITENDITEANQLSLHCPFCSNPVEDNTSGEALIPVICTQCGTLYHKACWQQSGSKCVVLGCGHDTYRVYGQQIGPVLEINQSDIAAQSPSSNGRGPSQQTRRLKHEQRRQVEQMQRPCFWQRFWQWLLDQIRIES